MPPLDVGRLDRAAMLQQEADQRGDRGRNREHESELDREGHLQKLAADSRVMEGMSQSWSNQAGVTHEIAPREQSELDEPVVAVPEEEPVVDEPRPDEP